jgi:WD40 repeat protein
MQQRTEVVIPMTADELVRAIERPAARVGVGVEPELVAALVADVNEQPGALPLLQYTLSELFEERADGRLTLGAYRALGGISGALAQRADAVYDALDAPGQTAARALFSRLVTLGEGVEDTRRRVLRAEVEGLSVMDGRPPTADGETENENASGSRPSAVGGPLDAFGRARLLAFDRDPLTRGPTVEIAHEALLRAWPRLRGWLDEDRAALRLSRLLTAAAAEWKAAGGADGFLLRGARLDQLAPLAGGTVALTEGERGYLAVSLAAREARRAAEEARLQAELATAQKLAETERRRADEQAYSAGRLRRRAALLAGALGLAVILAVAALVLGRQANQSATLAQANAAAAQTAEAQALGQGATAEAERVRAEAGEAAALSAEATAAAEAGVRATAEAIALQEQRKAEHQTLLATSRELAAAALNALSVDPELSLLLALQAFSTAHTYESENTLHRILPSLHLLRTFPPVGLSDRKLSPDGRYLANGAHDGLTVWDIPAALAGARDPVVLTVEIPIYEIAYSPDGTRITTFDADGIVRVLDALTGEVLSTLPGYSPELGNLNFSPDNTRLAIADLDGNLSVWDVQSGREIFTTSGHADVEAVGAPEPTGSIRQIKFSPDGSRLATAGNDGTARIWDADNGREIMTLTGHVTELNNLFFSYDGQRLATAGNDGTVKVWDLSQENLPGRLLLSLSHDEGVYGLGFSPDGTQLATGDRGGTITIWDTASGRKLLELAGHETTVYGPTFSPDGTRLITQSAEGVFKLWDVTHSRELFSLAGSPGPVGGPAFSPDGLYLATGHTDGNVLIWERATGQLRFTLPAHDGFVVDLAFSDDGTRLATASWDSTAKVWSVAEIVAGGTPEPVIMTGHADRVWRVGFTPDGSRLATGSVDETAKIWDVRSGELLATVTGLDEVGNGRIAALEISPDGKRLAIGAPDATVKIWDLTTTATTIDQPVLTIPIDTNFINDVAFSPDGSRLAVGHETSVIVWDISGTEGLVLFELLEHSGSTVAVDFSPDGRRLASASFDGTVKVWDMAGDGQELLTLSAHSDGVIGVAFSPDGKQLASASFDGTVQVYVLETSELIALAHDRLTRWWRLEECLAYLHTEACPPAPERFAANE